MSKLNIAGIVKNIKSRSNIFTPIIEAVVNSIEAIVESGQANGQVIITVKRQETLDFDGLIPPIKDIEIYDTGVGFNQKNRDSFDMFYSEEKLSKGGKGFGRFMFLKYFNDVKVESVFKEEEKFKFRKFNFGKQYQIIANENISDSEESNSYSKVFFNNVIKDNLLDKELETIARKLVEKLLIFFIDEEFQCPEIILREANGGNQITLNTYIAPNSEIQLICTKPFSLKCPFSKNDETFTAKIFKLYSPGNQKSKISLTAHNREVTETTLHSYIPEFEDDFFDEFQRGNEKVKKNYIIKTYVLGNYLNQNVSEERENFNFDKTKPDSLFELSQIDIELAASELTKEIFDEDVKVRAEKKKSKVLDYITNNAPWHRSLVDDIDFPALPYFLTDEKIELAFQSIKFQKEQESKVELRQILQSDDEGFEDKVNQLLTKVTDVGKNDLTHYVCTRKLVLQIFEELLKRNTDGKASLEKDLHNVIFPMGKNSLQVPYEDHNLWLLDERLVFSQYIASDKKISKSKDALGEPDLIIFDQKNSFRGGDNEFSNPLTIFEFKRPKRESYTQEEDPILQIGQYLDKIRQGKYELPEGLEVIKVNDNTPVYGYIVCDLTEKIRGFARMHQLTVSPDDEGFFGYHTGYKIYLELFSFKKLLKDANLRNKIFFSKLGLQ